MLYADYLVQYIFMVCTLNALLYKLDLTGLDLFLEILSETEIVEFVDEFIFAYRVKEAVIAP